LLHDTLIKPVATQQYFTKSQTIYKSPILFWQLFTKSSNTILATIHKNPNTTLATIYKSPILFWQLFTKKLKYYFGNYLQNIILATFTKSPILYWQLLQKMQYHLATIYKKPNITLTTFYRNPKLLG